MSISAPDESTRIVRLETPQARAVIHPETGGSIGKFEVLGRSGWIPVLDVSSAPGRMGVFALGCQVLVPFANRISGGGFAHDGRFHALAPNLDGEPYPIHGNGFQSPWTVRVQDISRVVLTFESGEPGPFHYLAVMSYSLSGRMLSVEMTVTNLAEIALPYGMGFHPWFPRTPNTRLRFNAEGYWSERADHLPESLYPCRHAPDYDFSRMRPLPSGWVNAAFIGWDGSAELIDRERGLSTIIDATAPLRTLMVYSPHESAAYVCVEPVSHSVDAHNQRGSGHAAPQTLQPGDSLAATMTIAADFL